MRKSKPKKRIILPDPKFNDVQVTRFVNNMMYDGKKSIAYSIFYDAVEIAEKKAGENGLEIFKRALTNIMPAVEVKSLVLVVLTSRFQLRLDQNVKQLLV